MMEWIDSALDWAKSHDMLLKWLSVGSLVLFLATPIVVLWLVTRLPTDYFSKKKRHLLEPGPSYSILRLLILIGKNALGIVLLLAGLVMLIAPGQGLLTIAVALILLEFPGKYRVERWLVTRRHVWRSINWLRKRAGRPELKSPR